MKRFSWIAILVIAMMMLCGCDGDPEPPAPTVAPAEQPIAPEVIEIEVEREVNVTIALENPDKRNSYQLVGTYPVTVVFRCVGTDELSLENFVGDASPGTCPEKLEFIKASREGKPYCYDKEVRGLEELLEAARIHTREKCIVYLENLGVENPNRHLSGSAQGDFYSPIAEIPALEHILPAAINGDESVTWSIHFYSYIRSTNPTYGGGGR